MKKIMRLTDRAGRYLRSAAVVALPLFAALMLPPLPAEAETLVIGRDSGVVWEGKPFSGMISGTLSSPILSNNNALVAISTSSQYACQFNGATIATINGITGLQLAPGVILVPRASVTGSWYSILYNPVQFTFSGTIGLPASVVTSSWRTSNMNLLSSPPWCFNPEGYMAGGDVSNFYHYFLPRTVNYSGSWVIIANGSQVNQSNISIPAMYMGSSGYQNSGLIIQQILPSGLSLRISNLQCTVATTTTINFGTVGRNTQPGAELAHQNASLTTSCNQTAANAINANINVQFRAISGLYNATPSRLALTQGGGYITGEIDNGVTGSGDCSGTGGIPFDNTQLKIGSITTAQTSQNTSNSLIWRLCSGGASLPSGAVDASTEMLVTFN